MNRVFTTLAVLHGRRTASGATLVSIRDYLERHSRADRFLDAGEGVLGVRNAPAMVKAAVGAALEESWSHVLLATESDVTDFRAAFSGLAQRMSVTTLPLSRESLELTRNRTWLLPLEQAAQCPPTAPAFGPGIDLGNEPAVVLPQAPTQWPSVLRPFVLAGPPVGLTDLLPRSLECGWVPMVDVWEQRKTSVSPDWVGDVWTFARTEAWPSWGQGWTGNVPPGTPLVLRTEPFCGTQLTEVALRSSWPGPVLVLEAQRIGPLDAGQRIRLEAFFHMCSAQGSGQGPFAAHTPDAPDADDSKRHDPRIGIFSTMPIEVLMAAGKVPVDVNNLFVNHPDPLSLVRIADQAGLPRTVCAWTRGLWGATLEQGLTHVVAVVQGDCSNNSGLAEALQRLGIHVIPFRFPIADPLPALRLTEELASFAKRMGTTLAQAEEVFQRLVPVRRKLASLERLGVDGLVPGSLVRRLLLTSTDMTGDVQRFESMLDQAMEQRLARPLGDPLRLAVFGVPTAFVDLHERLDELGRTVLWETEGDFAMLPAAETLTQQYQTYAYPYGVARRLARFLPLAKERGVQAVVRYHQSFCHHNLENPAVDQALGAWPCFTLEGDLPGPLAARDRLRLEAFLGEHSHLRTPQMRPKALADSEATMPHSSKLGQTPKPSNTILGLDVGSRFAKVVAAQDGRTFRLRLGTVDFLRQFATKDTQGTGLRLEALLQALGASPDLWPCVVATGYGRNRIVLDSVQVIPEIQAHAAGASRQLPPGQCLVVDVGGQDTKILWMQDGLLKTFVMNDRCAAGSGRYVENMARLLEVELSELLPHWEDPIELSATCATFGESEVVGLVAEGVPQDRIFAGVLLSVTVRTLQLAARLGAPASLPMFLAGGMAESQGLLKLLGTRWSGPVISLEDASWNGALGCLEVGTSTRL